MNDKIRKQFLQVSAIALFSVAAATGVNAHAAETAPASALPAAAQQGSVQFLSGGVGADESKAIKKAAVHWPLSLEFIGGDHNFVSDVSVTITDGQGGTILETSAQGPYMLVRLKPGHYTVKASYEGREETRKVSVSSSGHARLAFSWKHL